MTRAAIYARYSSDRQSEASIEDQVRLCRERAAREGWAVVSEHADRALSGASMLRPGLQEMLDAGIAGRFEVLVAEALDRLSRDQADVAALYKRLSFADVTIVTLAEGEISELHVGLKGTMNQLFLKDLAAKSRRGLRGRVEAGLSGGGNSYGYEVVRGPAPDGTPVTGERRINPDEATIIRRIFSEFAEGHSPKAIAKRLNAERIPGPRGEGWRDTAIRGHRQRGTGLLNNELYIGRLVWNRLRYVKDPATGKRVSRLNPPDQWITTEVSDLRIVDDALWERVKARQGEIDATPRVQAIRETRFWEKKRQVHLLTGLLSCGCCGGGFASVGRDYVACANARKLGACDQKKSFRRVTLEEAVLHLLRDRLMQPDAVAAFVAEFGKEMNAQSGNAAAKRQRLSADRTRLARKLDGLYEAIAEGLRTQGLKEKLLALETELAELDTKLAAPPPSPIRLHPNLAELYRKKVSDLAATLADPALRQPALELIRSLITRVTVRVTEDRPVLELEGALCAMINAAQPGGLCGVVDRSVEVVAGARNSRFLRLVESVVPRVAA